MGICSCVSPKLGGCSACSIGNFAGYCHAETQPVFANPQTGWICPNCHISNAPWKSSCCNGKQTKSENSYNVKITGTGTTCL